MPLVFIHLSDIHFNKKWCDHYDLDRDLRDQLENDVRAMRQHVGRARGILITGDVAFGGQKDDYEVARRWLKQLCHIAGCRDQDVWCVPGNHDVDRSIYESSFVVKNLHNTLRPARPEDLDEQLTNCLRDAEARTALFRSINNYNEFAAFFACRSDPEPLTWQDRLELNDGSVLCIHGANSTLVSNKGDHNATAKLILGTLQVQPTETAGVAYLFMAHHPPDWLIDADMVNKMLDARALVQLFGHKHSQTIDERNGCIRIVAGAVHPSRREQVWKPRYNWLTLSVRGTGDNRFLDARVFPRVWNDSRPEYISDTGQCTKGLDHRFVSLRLPYWVATPTNASDVADITFVNSGLHTMPPDRKKPIEEPGKAADHTDASDAGRALTYRFLSLPHIVRIEIAQTLGLLEDDDEGLRDFQLLARIVERATERTKLEELWRSVEQKLGVEVPLSNPYLGK